MKCFEPLARRFEKLRCFLPIIADDQGMQRLLRLRWGEAQILKHARSNPADFFIFYFSLSPADLPGRYAITRKTFGQICSPRLL